MNELELYSQVARATGESVSTIARMGFVPLAPSPPTAGLLVDEASKKLREGPAVARSSKAETVVQRRRDRRPCAQCAGRTHPCRFQRMFPSWGGGWFDVCCCGLSGFTP